MLQQSTLYPVQVGAFGPVPGFPEAPVAGLAPIAPGQIVPSTPVTPSVAPSGNGGCGCPVIVADQIRFPAAQSPLSNCATQIPGYESVFNPQPVAVPVITPSVPVAVQAPSAASPAPIPTSTANTTAPVAAPAPSQSAAQGAQVVASPITPTIEGLNLPLFYGQQAWYPGSTAPLYMTGGLQTSTQQPAQPAVTVQSVMDTLKSGWQQLKEGAATVAHNVTGNQAQHTTPHFPSRYNRAQQLPAMQVAQHPALHHMPSQRRGFLGLQATTTSSWWSWFTNLLFIAFLAFAGYALYYRYAHGEWIWTRWAREKRQKEAVDRVRQVTQDLREQRLSSSGGAQGARKLYDEMLKRK